MFTYKTKVHLNNTDATGVLYFPEQLKMALQTYEEFLVSRGFSLRELLNSDYLMPVVHVEADYLAPLFVNDEVEISLSIGRVGTSSVTFHYVFKCGIEVGRATIVHVLVDKESRKSVPIPLSLKEIFSGEKQLLDR